MAKTLEDKVKCGVGNCTYNKDHRCHAEILEVNPMAYKNKADVSDDTCCTTFKDSDKL